MGKCVDNNRCPIPEKGQRWVAWDRPMIISKQKQKKGNTRSLYRRIVCWYRIIKSCLALQSNSKTPKFCQGAKPRKGYYTKTNRECDPGGDSPIWTRVLVVLSVGFTISRQFGCLSPTSFPGLFPPLPPSREKPWGRGWPLTVSKVPQRELQRYLLRHWAAKNIWQEIMCYLRIATS